MKIDRLIGILSILLQQEKVTAPFLAEKFEVSRRTINRDIEDLCKAGIPIVTMQGQNGGISIIEGFTIDRTLFTSSEMQAVLAGLKSLDSVSGTKKYQQLMAKFSLEETAVYDTSNQFYIDLSSHYKSTLAPKIELIQQAISEQIVISFAYYGPAGESDRKIEPYLIVFQWSSWYVWGYCLERNGFRLFKLNRLNHLNLTEEEYEKRTLPVFQSTPEKVFPSTFEITAVFHPSMKWRLVEEYGFHCIEEREDGKLLFRSGFHNVENTFSWLLGFGEYVELTEPVELREQYKELISKMYQKYC